MPEGPLEEAPHGESAYGEIPTASAGGFEDVYAPGEVGADFPDEALDDTVPGGEEEYESEEPEVLEQPEVVEEESPEILLPDFLTRATSVRSTAPAQHPAGATARLSGAAETRHVPAEETPAGPARPAAAPPAPPAVEAAPRTPAATALVSLAGEVARLGVPEGQRAAARAALLDLARELDEETATWDSFREFLWMVADYPRLAQRAIPLLVPYLDMV